MYVFVRHRYCESLSSFLFTEGRSLCRFGGQERLHRYVGQSMPVFKSFQIFVCRLCFCNFATFRLSHSFFSAFKVEYLPNHPFPPLASSSDSHALTHTPQLTLESYIHSYLPPSPVSPPSLRSPIDGQVAMCLSPIYGPIHDDLRMWVKAHADMGVSKIFFYPLEGELAVEGSNNVRRLLFEYERRRLAEVIEFHRLAPTNILYAPLEMWTVRENESSLGVGRVSGHFRSVSIADLRGVRVPFADLGMESYCGQKLAMNDCLFRTVGRYRWVFFTDMDEYVVSPFYTSAQRNTRFFERFFHNLTRLFNLQDQSKDADITPIASFMFRNRMICQPNVDCSLPLFPSSCSPVAISAYKAQCSNKSFCSRSIQRQSPSLTPLPDISHPGFHNFLLKFPPFFSEPSVDIYRPKVIVDPILTYFMFVHSIEMTMLTRHGTRTQECARRANVTLWMEVLSQKEEDRQFISALLRAFNVCIFYLNRHWKRKFFRNVVVLPTEYASCFHFHFRNLPCHSIDTHFLDVLGGDLWNCFSDQTSSCFPFFQS